MANRLEHEFHSAFRHHAVPPIGPDGRQVIADRARQARALALREALRSAARGLDRAFGAASRFVRCAGYGASKRVPSA